MNEGYRPLIGISGSHNGADKTFFLRQNYMQAVLDAGGLPVLLPETEDVDAVSALVGRLDGILLAGGGDVDPRHFGQAKRPACGEPDALRDAFELLLIAQAMQRDMPIFGICRGCQVLAVALGGTLIQDIQEDCGIPTTLHRQCPPYDVPSHAVRMTPEGVLQRITGLQTAMVNSMHHQAVLDPGPNLVVEAVAEDGVIEGIALRGREDVFAVQYHPEYLSRGDAASAALFGALVRHAKTYHERKA